MDNLFSKELKTDFDKAFYKNLCERFSKEELAGMYTLANKREQDLKQEVEKTRESAIETRNTLHKEIQKLSDFKKYYQDSMKTIELLLKIDPYSVNDNREESFIKGIKDLINDLTRYRAALEEIKIKSDYANTIKPCYYHIAAEALTPPAAGEE